MDQNVKYLLPRMISLSNSVVCGDKYSCVKLTELPHGHQDSQKNLLFIFVFYNAIFVKVSTFSWIKTLKRLNNN